MRLLTFAIRNSSGDIITDIVVSEAEFIEALLQVPDDSQTQ